MDNKYFPYGYKSKEFLLKRSLYLCYILNHYYKVDFIVLACNTLSLTVLDFLKCFYNVCGVFDSLKSYINSNSVIMGSKTTISVLKNRFKNIMFVDGTNLISAIENNYDYSDIVKNINSMIIGKSNIILACTHFLSLKPNTFIIDEVKNKINI